MAWSAAIIGELQFPPGALDKWRGVNLAATDWSDWPGLLDGPSEPLTIGDAMAQLAAADAAPDVVRLLAVGDALSLQAWLTEDTFRTWVGTVARMFRAGAVMGARGELVSVAGDDFLGHRMSVGEGTTHFETVDVGPFVAGERTPEDRPDYGRIIEALMAARAAMPEEPKVALTIEITALDPQPGPARRRKKPAARRAPAKRQRPGRRKKAGSRRRRAGLKRKTSSRRRPNAKRKAGSRRRPGAKPSRR